MYGYGLHHRVLVALGCLGLAALMPYGALPTWVAVALAVLPIAVFELGAGLEEHGRDTRGEGWQLLGWHLQAYGALLYLVPYAVLTMHAGREKPAGWFFLIGIAFVGVPSAVSTLLAWRHVLAGRPARRPDPSGAGRLAALLGEPFLVGAVGLTLAAAGLALFRDPSRTGLELLVGLAFFGSVILMALAHGLERRDTSRRPNQTSPVHDALQTFTLLGFTGAALAFGLWWPDLSFWARAPGIALGTLGVGAAAWLGMRRIASRPEAARARPDAVGDVPRPDEAKR